MCSTKILKERRRGKKVEYLIDWKPTGKQTWDPTWEPAEMLSDEALQAYKDEKAKARKNSTASKKKRKSTASSAKKKRKAPTTKTKKPKTKKENSGDDNMEDESDEEVDEDADEDADDSPKTKRRKTAASSSKKKRKSKNDADTDEADTDNENSKDGDSTSSTPVITGTVDARMTNGTPGEPSYNMVKDDDDDPSLYPNQVQHVVSTLSDVPLNRYNMPCGSSRLANMVHFYGEKTVERLAGVLKLEPDTKLTEAVFANETGVALSDLLLRGAFDMKKGVPNRYLKRLRSCVEEITSMIEDRFSKSHRLAGDCKSIYEVKNIELAEVQKRGSTLDFSLNWWREHYPVLDRVAYHALWYRTVVKALGHYFDGKMRCEWIGLLHSPPGAKGQHVHRDGRRKDKKKSVSSEAKQEVDLTPHTPLFMSPNNTSVPCVPHSITVCVPLCDIKQVVENAMHSSAPHDEENKGRRHNGGTELFPASHMSAYLSKDSPPAKKNDDSSPKNDRDEGDTVRRAPLAGPYPKTVVLSKAGDCLGWGFDFAHNGGPNSSHEARQVMYFVYHLQGTEKGDENIKQFKDAKNAGLTLFMGTYSNKEEYLP